MNYGIVGFGVTGASVLVSLVEQNKLQADDTVTIFEPREELAVGLAYAQDDQHLLLNAYATSMSLSAANPKEFVEWLNAHYPQYDASEELVPRVVYGEYAKAKIAEILETSGAQVIHETVRAIDRISDDTYIIRSETGQTVVVDTLFLTIGNAPYKDPYHLMGTPGYIHNPYPVAEHLANLNSDTRVGIIGLGLTGFDLMNHLTYAHQLKHPVQFFTDTAQLNTLRVAKYMGEPLVYTLDADWMRAQKETHHGYIPLKVMVNQVASDLKANGLDLTALHVQYQPQDILATHATYAASDHSQLSQLQGYIAQAGPYLADLYLSLTPEDVRQFHTQYGKLFHHYHVRLAPKAVENLYEQVQAKRAVIHASLTQIEGTADGRFVLTTGDGETHTVDMVINATGFDFSLEQAAKAHPLLAHLLENGWLTAKADHGIQVTWPSCEAITAKGDTLERFYVLGPWIGNTHYANNAVGPLVAKTDALIASL